MTRGSLRRLTVLVISAVVAVLVPGIVTGVATGQPQAVDDAALFTALPGFQVTQGDRTRVAPTASEAYRLDLTALEAALAHAPSGRAVHRGAEPLTLEVPDPTGELARFRIQESPVLEQGLARQHPEIRTYAGVGLTDPTATIRLDLTPMGFHASVRGANGQHAWYVDPAYNRPGTTTHLSYYRSSVPQPDRPFVELDPEAAEGVIAQVPKLVPGGEVVRRTFRLAFVTDPSYAAYFGSGNVLAEKATLVNRVNQVYNDDLALQLVLVDGTDELNLDTLAEATGPDGPCGAHGCYAAEELEAGCTGSLLERNEFVIGQIIGADDYDVGHIGLGIEGGGIAGLGVVGGPFKADGCTGLPYPEGDFYAIDYVAHELGHQFAGNHTFNGTLGNCSLSNRHGATSVEPGSGSSVMAYAGICEQDDLQPHTDPYFSQRSIDEITAHVTDDLGTVDEQQVVNLSGFDAAAETFQLTYPGQPPVTLTRGALTYNAVTLAQAVQDLTGRLPEVSGYDGAGSPGDDGFTVDFSGSAPGEQIDTLGVVGAGDVTGFVGTIYNGGEWTNQGTTNATGNHAPTVTAPADRTIPVRTPFTLTATGSDADADPLTYLWEQNDAGPSSLVSGTSLVSNTRSNGPLFRVFGVAADVGLEDALLSPSPGQNLADGGPSRTFPDLAQVLAGHTNAATGACPAAPADPAPVPAATVECFSEFLPTAAYGAPLGGALHFRVTARDRFAAGAGTGSDDVTLSVDDGAGPFLVTSRRTAGTSAQAGQPETITWDVNGTDAAALAPMVRISLSTDGGATFTEVLAAATANDGSETVSLPTVSTTEARLKVEAVGNYFFDVNDADFTVTDGEDTTPPDTRITGGPKAGSFVLTRAVTLEYAAPDAVSFECTLDGTPVACGAGRVMLRRLSTRTHVFGVAARDPAGNLDPTPAMREFTSPDNDSELDRRGDWRRHRATAAYRGTYLQASSKGEALTRKAAGVTEIALVAGTGPGHGKVAVWFRGDRIATVDLRAGRRHSRVLLPVASFARPRSGQVRITTLSGRTVRIEGLGLS